ncbi:MAG: 4-hydroxy-tetrahydrodipicolinate synthase [Mailhella sp.]|nr:4-hydroxy-tetrahydrodipicolinate synthase [Mailhella sp.]
MFHGTITALLTPFKNGSIDEEAYRAHIEWQIEQGVNGVVPCGTTGESATMSHAEHEAAIRICVDQVKGRVPVIAGSGSNNTTEAISLTKFAKEAGADAALLISPYYNKPTQEGIFQHFKAVNDEVALPMFVYNVPGRTGSNILPSTQARMARELEHVIGCKEATANLVQISDIIEQCPEDFILLSGDDFTVVPTYSIGGKGVISVVSNVMPNMMSQLTAACERGDYPEARRLHYALEPLNRAMFVESNPIPCKAALAIMGRMTNEVRLPLCAPSDKTMELLTTLLRGQYGLI